MLRTLTSLVSGNRKPFLPSILVSPSNRSNCCSETGRLQDSLSAFATGELTEAAGGFVN